jgi:hypothetical protein
VRGHPRPPPPCTLSRQLCMKAAKLAAAWRSGGTQQQHCALPCWGHTGVALLLGGDVTMAGPLPLHRTCLACGADVPCMLLMCVGSYALCCTVWWPRGPSIPAHATQPVNPTSHCAGVAKLGGAPHSTPLVFSHTQHLLTYLPLLTHTVCDCVFVFVVAWRRAERSKQRAW